MLGTLLNRVQYTWVKMMNSGEGTVVPSQWAAVALQGCGPLPQGLSLEGCDTVLLQRSGHQMESEIFTSATQGLSYMGASKLILSKLLISHSSSPLITSKITFCFYAFHEYRYLYIMFSLEQYNLKFIHVYLLILNLSHLKAHIP